MKKQQIHSHNCHPMCRECDLIYSACQENIKPTASPKRGRRMLTKNQKKKPKPNTHKINK